MGFKLTSVRVDPFIPFLWITYISLCLPNMWDKQSATIFSSPLISRASVTYSVIIDEYFCSLSDFISVFLCKGKGFVIRKQDDMFAFNLDWNVKPLRVLYQRWGYFLWFSDDFLIESNGNWITIYYLMQCRTYRIVIATSNKMVLRGVWIRVYQSRYVEVPLV